MSRQDNMVHVRALISEMNPGDQLTRTSVDKALRKRGIRRNGHQINMALFNMYEYNELDRLERGVYSIPTDPARAVTPVVDDPGAITEKILVENSSAIDPIKWGDAELAWLVGELTDGSLLLKFNGRVFKATEV